MGENMLFLDVGRMHILILQCVPNYPSIFFHLSLTYNTKEIIRLGSMVDVEIAKVVTFQKGTSNIVNRTSK